MSEGVTGRPKKRGIVPCFTGTDRWECRRGLLSAPDVEEKTFREVTFNMLKGHGGSEETSTSIKRAFVYPSVLAQEGGKKTPQHRRISV